MSDLIDFSVYNKFDELICLQSLNGQKAFIKDYG